MIRRFVPIIGAVVIVAGCAAVPTRAGPSPPASTVASPPASPLASAPVSWPELLIALVGTVGTMELVSANADGSLAAVAGLAVPPDAAWLSGDGSTFVLTTLDGRILVGGPTDLAPAPGDLGQPHPLRAFGSIQAPSRAGGSSGGGRRLAFVEGDPGSGEPGRITVVTLDGREVRSTTLPRPAEGPPAWLPDARLAVVCRDQADRPMTLLVDPGTGRIATINGRPLRSIATAADVVATVDAEGTARAGGVTAWLAGTDLPAVPSLPGGPILMAQPSPDGRELAVVLADANGDAASIRILATGPPWHEVARFELPRGANRAVVGWQAVQ